MNIPLSQPSITQNEIDEVVHVLGSGWLSQGTELSLFEEIVARRSNRQYGIAVNSGTSALHLCMLSLGISTNDEVITTPFSFIATTNSILFVNAKPVFVDIDPESYNMNPVLLETAITGRSRAILSVETFGNMTYFDEYEHLAQKYQIPLVEDSCEAIGARLNNRPAGSFGVCSVFGFFPNKQVTTGEGGIILTDNKEIHDLCICLRNHGRDQKGNYIRLGYNYKLSEINAALGYIQFKRLNEILDKRKKIAALYNNFLMNVDQIHLPPSSHSWFSYVIRLEDSFNQDDRDNLIRRLKAKGINCHYYFPPVHLQQHIQERFGYNKGDFPQCERVAQRTIALPFFTELEEKDIKVICNTLKDCLASV